MLAKIANDALRLDQLKPTEQVHRAKATFDPVSGGVRAESSVFKNKIRSNNQVYLGSPLSIVFPLTTFIDHLCRNHWRSRRIQSPGAGGGGGWQIGLAHDR